MTEVVREWSGTAERVHQALQLADQRGQLVSFEPVRANGRGVAVRVVLRPVEPTPTGPRQDPDRTTTRRLAVVGVSVGVGLGVVGAVVWGVVELLSWASTHVAQILGAVVALLLIAAVLARVLVGGGDKHPCNR